MSRSPLERLTNLLQGFCGGVGRFLGTAAEPPPAERASALALLAVAFLLRLWCIFSYRFDSDETQHAHLAWCWSLGLTHYKDFRDNHTPLFHLSLSALLGLLDSAGATLYKLRIAMIPLAMAALWATHAILHRLTSPRLALWGIVALAYIPGFFLTSVEIRPDLLWMLLQVLAIGVAISAGSRPLRWLLVGVALGCALAASIKTLLMLLSIAAALPLALWLFRQDLPRGRRLLPPLACLLSLAGGFLLVVGLVVGAFANLGAVREMHEQVILHHASLGEGDDTTAQSAGKRLKRGAAFLLRVTVAIALLGATLALAKRLLAEPRLPSGSGMDPHATDPALSAAAVASPTLGHAAASTLILCSVYNVLVWGFWPVMQRQTTLTAYPLLVIAAGLILHTCLRCAAAEAESNPDRHSGGDGQPTSHPRPAPRPPRRALPAFLAVPACLFAWMIIPSFYTPVRSEGIAAFWNPFRRDARATVEQIDATLRLTGSADRVIDSKGETVFRRRATAEVLERFTVQALQSGLVPDTLIAQIVAARAPVVNMSSESRYPRPTRRWLRHFYIGDGPLRVVGLWLDRPEYGDPGSYRFDLPFPAPFRIVAGNGTPLRGVLNGKSYDAATVMLDAGPHVFRPLSGHPGAIAVVWAPALQRGFDVKAAWQARERELRARRP